MWKHLAGNPDHDDFAAITNDINMLNENNNEQVIINRISNLKNIANDLNNA